MTYGHFHDQSKEYRITRPDLPMKWTNYVGGLSFGGFLDHTGGAQVCMEDPAVGRITKYIPQMPDSDLKGFGIYIKDANGRLISPFQVPCGHPLDHFTCRVGLGYSIWETTYKELDFTIRAFVPKGSSVLLYDMTITNGGEDQTLDVYPVVEYSHFEALKQLTNADWVPQTMGTRAVTSPIGKKTGSHTPTRSHRGPGEEGSTSDQQEVYTTLFQQAWMQRQSHANYLTSNRPALSFETDRQRFLGDHRGGTWQKPLGLLEETLSNQESLRGNSVGVVQHRLVVKKGRPERIIFQVGRLEAGDIHSPEIQDQVDYFRQEAHVDQAFDRLLDQWDSHLSPLQVQTPSASLDSMVNVHNPRQCWITFNWSRYLSLNQLGYGARGLGVRDTAQDTMGIVVQQPQAAKEKIMELWTMQRTDGSSYHQYNPKTLEATEGDAREMPDRPQYYGDDHLWPILATASLIRETGHLDLLGEEVSFYHEPDHRGHREVFTVLEHIRRALAFTHDQVGADGLPLLGFADWNDPVNLPTGAQSVMLAGLYGKALLEAIELAKAAGEVDLANLWTGWHGEMKETVNSVAWDGQWYIRYIDADGTRLGSQSNPDSQLYINAQSWLIMAGFVAEDRSDLALAAIEEHMATDWGIKLSYPSFNGFDPSKGGITTYPPGAKENGGIFLHANPWVMIAETLQGASDRAMDYYDRINPVARNGQIEKFESPPYVYPQNILGDEHPQHGLARNAWLTGTASWCYQAAVQHILGLHPEIEGLRLQPVLPEHWPGYTCTRVFRGTTFHINVTNQTGQAYSLGQVGFDVTVDGLTQEDNLLTGFDGQDHDVTVTIKNRVSL